MINLPIRKTENPLKEPKPVKIKFDKYQKVFTENQFLKNWD